MSRNKGIKRVIFVLPALLIYLSVIVLPSLFSLYISFFEYSGIGKMKYVGFKNYIDLFFNDSVFITALKNNIIWMILTLVFTVSIALLLAVVMNRGFKGRVIYRAIIYFPYTLSAISVGTMWVWIYHPQLGLLNGILKLLGLGNLTRGWLSDPNIALYAVYIASLWQGIGGPFVLFLSGLQTIPTDCLESALIDGAGKIRTFFNITLPLLKETLVVVFATQIINSFKIFDLITATTGGGPAQKTQTLATWMYQQSFMFNKFGTGAAISWIMVVVLSIIIIPYTIYQGRE